MNTHIINLDLAPERRWETLRPYKKEMDELLGCYLKDFAGAELMISGISTYKSLLIAPQYLKEIEGLAAISDFSEDEILLANLYYDLLKFYFGCTAFATYSEGQMFHARNLDWHTENNILSEYSMIFDFQKGGKSCFKTIGWPGFIGALSGIKPNAFALTLNAVSSTDMPQLASPVTFVLRDTLTHAQTFDDAINMLESAALMSDSLILLSGVQEEEKVVIERTPSRYATRKTNISSIVVTNDYKVLTNEVQEDNILQNTSCSRYERTEQLLTANTPKSKEACLSILKDDGIMMGITVQQMVFQIATGDILLKKTNAAIAMATP